MICIYKITNTINGKVYIGQTKDFNTRWKRHKWDANNPKRCKSPIHLAIKKYGADNFTIEIIHNNLTREEANNREIEEININNSRDNKFGYNLTSGGEGYTGVTGEKHHRFGKKAPKLAELNRSRKGVRLTDQHKAKINPKGRKVSEEVRKAMSERRKQAWTAGVYDKANWRK